MGIKERTKAIISENPIAQARRKRMRGRLRNKDFTLLAPNCMGGILLHDLGLRFLTPTVNLMMKQTEFLDFVLEMDKYLAEEFTLFKHPNIRFPARFYLRSDFLLSQSALPTI